LKPFRYITGKIVPVKKEHKRMISEELTEKGITFSVSKDKVNPGRVFFRATVNSDK
jgi:hypothetical protein